MNIQEKKLRDIISQEIKKIAGVNETDLVASDKTTWDNKKTEFKTLVSNLINNIEADDYDDAAGEITKTMGILKTWKSRIDKGLMDSELKEGIENVTNQAAEIVKHEIGDEFYRFVIPGSEKYNEGDEGSYSAEAKLALPRHFFVDLETAALETNEQLKSYNYRGPGQHFSRCYIYAIKQDAQRYILGININGGYDI
jgi:hypothetical protein